VSEVKNQTRDEGGWGKGGRGRKKTRWMRKEGRERGEKK
jgi:hypothetical protein